MVVQRGQRTVAEAEEPGVDVPLVALDALALLVQFGLGCHDCLNILLFGQGVLVHVIVDHEQAAFQIGTGKAVVLHFLDAAVAGGISMSRFSTSPMRDLPSPPLPTMSIIFCPLVLGIRQ